ncbi:ribonuclease H family protein [Neorhodopirellula lusitana]|uniref:hypothetical protein n=1 Tax=Neorhodopirellula lusitana TaxID=445327 RepID=UPI00384FE426
MWLIAIDEAGYGPKLGPLVVAASLWRNTDAPMEQSVDVPKGPDPFSAVAAPVMVGSAAAGTRKIRVDDSKQIFRSKSSGKDGGSLRTLHAITSVAHHACGRSEATLTERLATLIPRDFDRLANIPWLASMVDAARLPDAVDNAITPIDDCQAAIEQWSQSQWKLRDVQARMVDAEAFNQFCESSGNKSDLLGETSIGLAADLIKTLDCDGANGDDSSTDCAVKNLKGEPENAKGGSGAEKEPVQIFFDRHGGRRYYAGPIQQVLGKTPVEVISETAQQSVYETQYRGRRLRLHFTVKGDRFVPVALSSLHAKYLREVAMSSLNAYFETQLMSAPLQEAADASFKGETLVPKFSPTAGYPTDAVRFLGLIDPVIERLAIPMLKLVRVR